MEDGQIGATLKNLHKLHHSVWLCGGKEWGGLGNVSDNHIPVWKILWHMVAQRVAIWARDKHMDSVLRIIQELNVQLFFHVHFQSLDVCHKFVRFLFLIDQHLNSF